MGAPGFEKHRYEGLFHGVPVHPQPAVHQVAQADPHPVNALGLDLAQGQKVLGLRDHAAKVIVVHSAVVQSLLPGHLLDWHDNPVRWHWSRPGFLFLWSDDCPLSQSRLPLIERLLLGPRDELMVPAARRERPAAHTVTSDDMMPSAHLTPVSGVDLTLHAPTGHLFKAELITSMHYEGNTSQPELDRELFKPQHVASKGCHDAVHED
ncbi:hypothetical protein EYF80_029780 [Liparis tanakae]|uniref:Uncharacterized protein n=1 Tax=Liparis tanakae TaxID=230148 RepID=A0A4Z2H520_9TELE|nr:hypothetical protein EYF80_029780 [Liparis tanakae]